MAQLGLCVTPNHFPVTAEGKPPRLLLLVAKRNNVGNKHCPMKSGRLIIGHCLEAPIRAIAENANQAILASRKKMAE